MTRIFLLLFAMTPLFLLGQERHEQVDSATYFSGEMRKLYRLTMDSLMKSDRFTALQEGYKRTARKSKYYGGLSLFGSVSHSNYESFNKSIAGSGFEPLRPVSGGVGIGVSFKGQHSIFDFYFFSLGFGNHSKKGDEKISSATGNFLHFDIGYDVLSSKWASIYPYAGLSIREATLNYTKDGSFNPAYTNISNIVSNTASVYSSSTRVGYQAGMGIDLVVSNYNDHSNAIVLFAKGGLNKPIGRDKFKIQDVKYDPEIRNNWVLLVGVKFVSRR